MTAATQNRYGEAYWNLPDLFVAIIQDGGPKSRVAAFFSGAALVISQIGEHIQLIITVLDGLQVHLTV